MLKLVSFTLSGLITSTRGSCPIQTKKVYYVGQSINESNFTREFQVEQPITKFIHIGRADPSKKLELIIETIHKLRLGHPDLELTLIGNPSTDHYSRAYESLQEKWESAVTEGWLTFHDSIPRRHIPPILSENHVFVHAYSGSLDKTLIEATMSGLAVATLNEEYQNDFGCWQSDCENLFLEIKEILEINTEGLRKEIERRRQLAIKLHSLDHWVSNLTLILLSPFPTNPSG
jgi:glycosyltransferase involved in cell wall biosynthesis